MVSSFFGKDYRSRLREGLMNFLRISRYINVCFSIYRELLKNEPIFKIPDVIDELTTSQVLTTEYVEGLPVDQCVDLDQDSRNIVCIV